ncbi:MAG: hypothetical protein H6733_06645 [Alphaproteobacteria bacterium]|nr:hypothetical protein [Alphaproteobacteria bacterium]
MGFFDKVKAFAGGSTMVEIAFTSIEKQPPETASVPIGDSVIKGRYRITAKKPCTVLRHVAEVRTRMQDKDGSVGTRRASDVNDEAHQVIGAPYQFPYDMQPGDTMDAGFLVHRLDLASYYEAYGVAPLDPAVEVYIKVIVDVKGSPFDPSAETPIRVV